MPLQPPSFGSRQYWDDRFTSNSNPFEWLEAPTALDPYLVDALKETPDQNPELLHIGCGTSLLSYHLRAHVRHPEQIHNLDYSEVAIEVGKKREAAIFTAEQQDESRDDVKDTISDDTNVKDTTVNGNRSKEPTDPPSHPASDEASSIPFMRWSSANLLSHSSLLEVCKPSAYSVIVDKSTSDSIACADDVHVPLPYHVSISSKSTSSKMMQSTESVHPVHILAIHLALVAKPKARWVALSYSQDRFPFLLPTLPENREAERLSDAAFAELDGFEGELDEDLDEIPQDMIDGGLPDPGTLWALVEKYEIEVPPQETNITSTATTITHRPKLYHWIYTLERTDVQVYVREP